MSAVSKESHGDEQSSADKLITIESRLNLFLTLVIGLLCLLQWGAAVGLIDELTDRYIQTRLQHDAEALQLLWEQKSTKFSTNANEDQFNFEIDPIFNTYASGHYFELHWRGAQWRSQSLGAQVLWPQSDLEALSDNSFEGQGPEQQRVILYQHMFSLQDQPARLIVAEDVTPLYTQLWHLSGVYALFSLLFGWLCVLFQRRVIIRVLAPLKQSQNEVEALLRGERKQLSEQVPLEILPLVRELNRLLQVQAQRLQRSRQALENLAHALKKPLGVMEQSLSEIDVNSSVGRLLQEQQTHLRGLIEHELRRGQTAGPIQGEWIQLAQELPLILQLLSRTYQNKNIEIKLICPENLCFLGDRQDILELFGNLLDNAFKWSRHQIQIECRSLPDGMYFQINDDGPGCPPEQLKEILKRGRRADQQQPGHGFGLAIAREIVEVYHGELELSESENDGFRVSGRLFSRRQT